MLHMQKFIFLSENTPLNTHASKLQVFRQTILRTGISRLIHFVATLGKPDSCVRHFPFWLRKRTSFSSTWTVKQCTSQMVGHLHLEQERREQQEKNHATFYNKSEMESQTALNWSNN